MTRMTIAEKMARRRLRRIGRMVATAARILQDVDFKTGAASRAAFGGYDYASDADLRALVEALYDNSAVGKIHVPRKAVAAYCRGD